MSLREKLIELLGGSNANDDEDDEAGQIVDECPAGGEHEVQEIRPATARGVVFRYCKRCRKQL